MAGLVKRAWLARLAGFVLIVVATRMVCPDALAQRQMEQLGRAVVAVPTSTSSVYVGWRLLGADPDDIAFNVYRSANGGSPVLLNGAPLQTSCNLVDAGANPNQANSYFVRAIIGGIEQAPSASYTIPANAPVQPYFAISLQPPPGGVTPDAVAYGYSPNDCSVGDLDGDGEYEIVLKWDPSNSKDNSQSGYTGDVFLDAYKLDGTRLWRIDLGRNIRAGAHYTQFMVYDLDGDGKAELACKTAPGTVDGQSNDVLMPGDDPNADYRNSSGYILTGPEYLTIFNGETGAALATTNYVPPRGTVSSWGDSYGNRVDRFLACVAHLDGKQPSLVMCRGYYTRTVLAAWDWRNGKLTQRWVFDSNNPGYSSYAGQGNHNLSVGDVDGDGKDEIVYGACSIDDNGAGLYNTGLAHGDAMHLSDMDPDRTGLEVWDVHEVASSAGGGELRDAHTGQLLFGYLGTGDTGRGMAAHLDAAHRGYQLWSSASDGVYDIHGQRISANKPSVNFAIWWDADPERELLDGTKLDKWTGDGTTRLLTIYNYGNAVAINGTKANPCLSADILGDWREEMIFPSADSTKLLIFTTTIPSTNRFYTLMHDPQYRLSVAWQNVAYNQPPHTSFYIGGDMRPAPLPPITGADLAWRGGEAGNTWDVAGTSNWFANGVWTNTAATTFSQGNSVLFDLAGSNNVPVNLAGTLSPARVTVFSPKDYVFAGNGSLAGTMMLVKSGPGTLTLDTTNVFTGATVIAGGALFVNGSLEGSPVTVERRGTVEGPAEVGGGGRLGQGLTVQRECIVTVGAGTNSAGVLTISNSLVELGNVLNRFDLSSDPTAVAKANDRIHVAGNLVLSGTNTIEIHQLDGYLGDGVYPLFSYSGTLTGSLSNLVLKGTFTQTVALTNPPGIIGLAAVFPAYPPAAPTGLSATPASAFRIDLHWVDNSTDENAFLIERSTDNVLFTQIDLVGSDVINYSNTGLSPGTTYYYRVRGTNLAGASGYAGPVGAATFSSATLLTWLGDGTANVWDLSTTSNWLDGASRSVYRDGAHALFDDTGSNNLPVNLTGALEPDSVSVSANKNYVFGGSGSLDGPMALFKSSPGTLTILTTNTYSGGTTISNGTIVLGNIGANHNGLGVGQITFAGGILEFNGVSGSTSPDYGGNTNALVVPAGQTGTIRVPQRFLSPGLSGPLTGTGTLHLVVNYVRGDIRGDWSGFGGTIEVAPNGSGVDDFRVVNAAGFPNARLIVNDNVLMYSRAAANAVIPIGEFAASSGATISAGGGTSAGTQSAVTWRVGGLGTDATNAALIQGTTSLIKEGAGAWTLAGNNTYSGPTTVAGGTLWVNGDQSTATGPVTVQSAGTLGGVGTIGGNTTVNGTLAPGHFPGTLTFAGSLVFNAGSRAVFGLSRAPLTNDQVRVQGSLTFGGTLGAVNAGAIAFQAGDNFRLFDAAGYGGAFGSLDLPALDAGVAWSTNRLSLDGRLWVVKTTPPVLGKPTMSGGELVVSGSGGTPNWTYFVLSSTNLSAPLPMWSRIATNQFDVNGNFTFTVVPNPAVPQKFLMLEVP